MSTILAIYPCTLTKLFLKIYITIKTLPLFLKDHKKLNIEINIRILNLCYHLNEKYYNVSKTSYRKEKTKFKRHDS